MQARAFSFLTNVLDSHEHREEAIKAAPKLLEVAKAVLAAGDGSGGGSSSRRRGGSSSGPSGDQRELWETCFGLINSYIQVRAEWCTDSRDGRYCIDGQAPL